MKTEIHRLFPQFTNSYLIRERGVVVVDAGSGALARPNSAERFLSRFKALHVEPEDVSLVVITHAHFDHVCSLNELKKLTGCRVALNNHEKEWLAQGQIHHPPGITPLGRVFSAITKLLFVPFFEFEGTSIDLVLEDGEFDLTSYGVAGKVIHTPGHSPGSSTLLLTTGDAFVGDLANNGLGRIGPGMEFVGDEPSTIRRSWRLLLEKGAKRLYPGHGKPFQAEILTRWL